MTKKPVVKKRPAVERNGGPRRAKPARGGISISGGIHARRDVIVGDQYNSFRQQIAQIASPEEFLAGVHELQSKLAEIKNQPDLLRAQVETIEVIEGQVQQAIEEAQKPKPYAARIHTTLTSAKAVMDSLSESLKSAVGLGTVIAALGRIAMRVFGG